MTAAGFLGLVATFRAINATLLANDAAVMKSMYSVRA
jgi:hypothetical protein